MRGALPANLANARFKVSLDLKVTRAKDGSTEEYPEHGVQEMTLEEVVEHFGSSPGFEEWLTNALEEKARREEGTADGA